MAGKKRILVIYPSPVFGGGSIESLIDFLNSIDREKFDILLMIPDSQPLISGLAYKTEQKNVIRHPLTENNNIFLYTIAVVKFLYYLSSVKPDLIYVSD